MRINQLEKIKIHKSSIRVWVTWCGKQRREVNVWTENTAQVTCGACIRAMNDIK